MPDTKKNVSMTEELNRRLKAKAIMAGTTRDKVIEDILDAYGAAEVPGDIPPRAPEQRYRISVDEEVWERARVRSQREGVPIAMVLRTAGLSETVSPD